MRAGFMRCGAAVLLQGACSCVWASTCVLCTYRSYTHALSFVQVRKYKYAHIGGLENSVDAQVSPMGVLPSLK